MTTHIKDFTVSERLPSNDSGPQNTTDSFRLYKDFFKRILDIAFVIMAAPIAGPMIAIMALLVARDGASPFFTQRRVGRNGRVFKLLKIRTMMPDAQNKLSQYLESDPAAKIEWENTQKLKDDIRITPIGKILRKSSLDELPQLWNVLKGDMSMVGPRPIMEEQKPLYPGTAYYAIRPGITGSWQVSGRNQTSFAARAQFDADYHNNLSFTSDLSILARTVVVVLRCSGY